MPPNSNTLRLGCLFIIGLTLLAIVVLVVWVWCQARIDADRGWTVERLEASIKTEIPHNATRQEVEAWFRAHDIATFYFTNNKDDSMYWGDVPKEVGVRDEDLSGAVIGYIEGERANVGFLESGRISIFFFLDERDREIGRKVEYFIYSL